MDLLSRVDVSSLKQLAQAQRHWYTGDHKHQQCRRMTYNTASTEGPTAPFHAKTFEKRSS